MTKQSPNDFDLFHLKENYVNHIIDGMDVDSLAQIAHDLLMDEYEKLSWDEVTEEIVNLYDEDTLIDLIPEVQTTSWPSGTASVAIRHPLRL